MREGNVCGSSKGVVRNQRTAPPVAKHQTVLLVALALLALGLFSGCASTPGGGAYLADQYNPTTGYPAVGHTPTYP